MEGSLSTAQKMLQFIAESPSCFHVVDTLKRKLDRHGFQELKEQENYELQPGGSYYVIRNGSSILAFKIPEGQAAGFHIAAAHSDSPGFKVKQKPEMNVEDQYVRLNVEKYGGMITSAWLDRPLSLAGRVVISENGRLTEKLVNIDRDLLVIPNLAIHMNRDMNKGYEYKAQTDLLPLFAGGEGEKDLQTLLAKEIGTKKEQVLDYDLYVYCRDQGRIIGNNQEFVLSPRLDDLQCVYGCMEALLGGKPKAYIDVCVIFDNEEVGSTTKQGADSTFLSDNLERIHKALPEGTPAYEQLLSESFVISADNAHAVHPNHPEKADPTSRPFLNGGIVIKYHGSQRYTTDALSGAFMKELCRRAEVPYQTYHNHSDVAGGSTLGNISTAHVSVNTVDIGLPQLAMHSACETAGVKDTEYLIRAVKCFFEE